ncbi:MAG: Ryanodine receptor Ryr, partial [Candidatus Omnitrophica bacterium]|nr:Ryanodine receptor Ryr [Candidatus Omnitrophota bacterium]
MGGEENGDRKTCIAVNGDAAVDWFEVTTPSHESQDQQGCYEYNWQVYPGILRFEQPGGSLLLAEFIRNATSSNKNIEVVSPAIEDLQFLKPDQVVHVFAGIKSFSYSTDDVERQIFRLNEWKGVTGTNNIKPLAIAKKDLIADYIVLDDSGNGFRDETDIWGDLIANSKTRQAKVILKMSRPLGQGPLWDALLESGNLFLLIVEADNLRLMDVKISRCLSWERTAQDLAWQVAYNRCLAFLHKPEYLIVRFGADGAVLFNNRDDQVKPLLFFDPKCGEEDFESVYPGKMVGIGNAFTAGLVASIVDKQTMENAVRNGILSMKRLWQTGFGDNIEQLGYQYKKIFKAPEDKNLITAEAEVPLPSNDPAQKQWTILEQLPTLIESIAANFVLYGKDDLLDRVPLGKFGNLSTYERSEIESFNSIRNLVCEYLQSPAVTRPLSIGVFGPPGSGKSFGVTEVVKSIAPGKVPKDPLEFNLSQFNSIDELITSFHKVRDVALEGIVPLVFFDEFDSSFNQEKLGWLKYFLAPMQDGYFHDGENKHPLGKAIFVFAGGTTSTCAEFIENEQHQFFKDAKGTDFVSRLRGFINIKGPNPSTGELQSDRLAMIRRATVLRFLLKNHAPHIFKAGKECLIDSEVLHAFLKAPHYNHGIRSMQSIIEMSSLARRKKYEQAALPSVTQLALHVDADAFNRIV